MDQTYENAIAAIAGVHGFNGSGVARWPHHLFTFHYPDFALLDEEMPAILPPRHHKLRSEPTRSPFGPVEEPTSCMSLVDISPSRNRPSRARRRTPTKGMRSTELEDIFDAVAQSQGNTRLSMMTFAGPEGPDRPVYRISRTTQQRNGERVDSSRHDFTTAEFMSFVNHQDCSESCRHWWHNLDELASRCHDMAVIEVQQYAAAQGQPLPEMPWKEDDDSGSGATVWSQVDARLHKYDTPLPDQSKLNRGKRREVWVHRDTMVPGIAYLLRFARRKELEPRRLNPARTNEADVMAEMMSNVIVLRHGWSMDPGELREILMLEVLRALAATAIPPIDPETVEPESVPLAPGFRYFLDRFTTRYVNWCLDEDREYEHVYQGRTHPSIENEQGGAGRANGKGHSDNGITRASKRQRLA